MNAKMKKLLEDSLNIHIPLPPEEDEMAETRLEKKKVLESRLISDMESLSQWQVITTYSKTVPEPLADMNDLSDRLPIIPTPTISLSDERCVTGKHSLKFTHPTNLPRLNERGKGRIYAQPSAVCMVNREDWTEWNRLSVWVYPQAFGIKSLTLRVQLHNDGIRKVPDRYERDGAHNVSLKNEQWNHIVLEIPYLDRECVTGVSFDYDMVGHENDAADQVTWFIDKLELQKVDCDHYEGWIPKEDRLCYSHLGYQPGAEKIAIASDTRSDHFKLIETDTGKVILNKPIRTEDTPVGRLEILDFSEVTEEGNYLLTAGDLTSRVFSISKDVWESSVWKVLNFFLALRCGYEVKGKHRKCHADNLLKHGDQWIIADGGWHDAGDLAQGMVNTIEGAAALENLALSLKDSSDSILYKRVLEEAKWGLDYVLKTRFGDGFRSSYFSSSIWTDGVIGTSDDITEEASQSAYTNLSAAYAEALGAVVFNEADPDYARYALKIAKEDFDLGVKLWKETEQTEESGKKADHRRMNDRIDPMTCSAAALAAAKLYACTEEEKYEEQAAFFADIVMQCQQKELPDWDVPLTGFYYQDRKKDLIWHHNHMAYAWLPSLAMRTLCETFPHSPRFIKWYAALTLESEYYRRLSHYTYPFGMIPAGVYHENEGKDLGMKTYATHPQLAWELAQNPEEMPNDSYTRMVHNGSPVGNGYFVRNFPVWFSFRGNYNVMLSETVAINAAASLRNNCELYNIAQNQYEFIIGKNPFGQSTMYGEGHDYVQLYAVQPGQTVGALSVGMESHFEEDTPYWPQVNTATYKEVWVCSATKWLWCMADSFRPACVSGYIHLKKDEKIVFTHLSSRRTYETVPHPRTGYYEITLPCGSYQMTYGKISRQLNLVNGKKYELDGDLFSLTARHQATGNKILLTLHADSETDLKAEVKADNIAGLDGIYTVPAGGEVTLEGEFINPAVPYVGIVIPNDRMEDQIEFTDERLK